MGLWGVSGRLQLALHGVKAPRLAVQDGLAGRREQFPTTKALAFWSVCGVCQLQQDARLVLASVRHYLRCPLFAQRRQTFEDQQLSIRSYPHAMGDYPA